MNPIKTSDSEDSEENDDGPCAKLTDCVDPGGINWICCDHCSRWFHCACVGLRIVFLNENIVPVPNWVMS